jgi:hypothetical protein
MSSTQYSALAVLTPTKTRNKPPSPVNIDNPPPTAKVPPAMNDGIGSSASHQPIQYNYNIYNCDNLTVNIGCTYHNNTATGSDVSFAKS